MDRKCKHTNNRLGFCSHYLIAENLASRYSSVMQFIQSTRQRKHVLLIETGADLVQALRQYCQTHRIRSGWFSGQGTLRRVEGDDTLKKEPFVVEALAELVQWNGCVVERNQVPEIQGLAHVMFYGENHAFQTHCGSLRTAQVEQVWVYLDAWDDALIQSASSASGSPTFRLVSPEKSGMSIEKDADRARKASSDSPVSWDKVQMVSSTLQRETAMARVEMPRSGDIVEHATFGRCTVMSLDEDEEHLTVRVKSGRMVELSLVFLQLESLGEEGDKKVFRAIRRK